MDEQKLKRLAELTSLLSEAAKAYYSENREIMANIEYDKLCDELSALEDETGAVLAGSPTIRVGYEVSEELPKEAHPYPLLSLDKTKDADALGAWLGDRKGLLSWKLDGLTVALTYRDGELFRGVTRGDGTVGEVITPNVRAFENIPLRIAFKGELIVRGEAVIRYSDFEKINDEIEEADSKYKNPRNLCSGSVRQLDSSVTAKRRVRYYAFSLARAEGAELGNSREEQMKFLHSLGFQTVEYMAVTGSSEVKEAVRRFASMAGSSDLPSDGLVLIYDDIAYGASLGRTAKFPRDAIAFKWADELARTVLKEVEWSASRTGLINPIAVFDPVDIEGSTVSRASLHNISIMEELELGPGDVVTVYKANMIIPQIAENLTRSGMASIPETCPVCGSPTEIKDNAGVRSLHCTNPDCYARRIGALSHFVSKGAMNIEGLSESTLEKFIAKGFLHEFADLYHLADHETAIVEMDGFGRRSFDNIISAVEVSRDTTPARLLFSLGIPTIGLANAKAICKAFRSDWGRISSASVEELAEIHGIGSVMADYFTGWFANEDNCEMVARLLPELRLSQESGGADDGLSGLTFVITGTLESYSNRDELKDFIEGRGGKVTGGVSDKTDYLINNDVNSASSKNKKAQELGVSIISEEEFQRQFGALSEQESIV